MVNHAHQFEFVVHDHIVMNYLQQMTITEKFGAHLQSYCLPYLELE